MFIFGLSQSFAWVQASEKKQWERHGGPQTPHWTVLQGDKASGKNLEQKGHRCLLKAWLSLFPPAAQQLESLSLGMPWPFQIFPVPSL